MVRHGVVVVVGGGEGAPATGEGAQVHGVAGELGRGSERDDDLVAVVALVGAGDAGPTRVEVTEHVPLAVGRDRPLQPGDRLEQYGARLLHGLADGGRGRHLEAHLVGVDRVGLAVVHGHRDVDHRVPEQPA